MSMAAPLQAVSAKRQASPASAGNRLSRRTLTFGMSSDALETEADRTADRVMSAEPNTTPTVGRAPAQTGSGAGQVLGSVEQALAAPGRSLDPAIRREMEQRFGYDFSSVRVHSGAVAEQSARDVGANAYTVGRDIVFGAGRFEPQTPKGRRLLAHELTHVVQQRGCGRGGAQTGLSPLAHTASPAGILQREPEQQRRGAPQPPGQTRPATPAERREFARMAIEFLRGQGEFFALQPNRDTAQLLGHLRTTVTKALTVIESDPAAVEVAEDLRVAYREAVRVMLEARTQTRPGSTATPPTLRELYDRHRDAILPFGRDVDAEAAELSAELAAPLPSSPTAGQTRRHTAIESARQRLRVITASVDMPIENLFSTQGATTTIPLPGNTAARFASTIPARLRHGLQNVAGELARSALTANTTVMLALDLRPFGGTNDVYRFTRLDLGRLGSEILIERQGAVGQAHLPAAQRARLRARFSRFGFRRAGFAEEEFEQVLIGLSEIPDGVLSSLGNLRFERAGAPDARHPDAAAEYDQATHTIRVFNRAFQGGMTRLGRAGHVLTFAAHAVVHEVGHALDLHALRTTAAATDAAQQALLAEFGTGGTNFRIPGRGAPDQARFNQLNRAVTQARGAESAARSRSGARWAGRTAVVTDALAARARQPAFRQAALQDGGPAGRRMPTDYPNPESVWQEYFADSFSLFQTSPELLQRIRPNVFRFMQQEFPP